MTEPLIRVATRKGLFTAGKQGDQWKLHSSDFIGDNISAVIRHPVSGTLFAALDHGHFGVKLQRCRDGEQWQEIPVPAYPPRDEIAELWVDIMGRTIPDSLQLIWCLEPGHPSQGERLWAGTIPGGLFRSDDGGDSWHLVDSLWNDPLRRKWFGGGMDYPGIHSILVHPEIPEDITIAISCGGIWHSADDGASWESIGDGLVAPYTPPEHANDPVIQDVHRLARCRNHPDRMWLQHHQGLYRSADAGRHWMRLENVAPTEFGFPVVAHPDKPETAWFVPEIKDEHRIPPDGQVVVTRTDDNGKSFATFKNGLPGPDAYDLVFRHSLDLDPSGRRLAMGSTTGSLWISEDSGEHWQTISNHLPPIYAVRFDD